MKHLNGFDGLASFYDRLARIAFGNTIRLSHHAFLEEISAVSNVLVLGGGTGEFLPRLRDLNRTCAITYIDASAGMIREALQRIPMEGTTYIHGTENSIPDSRYDAVVTFFYLDLFDDNALSHVVEKISDHLTETGIWLVAEFTDNGKWWQRTLLKFMYLFFGFSTGLKTRRLAHWKKQLAAFGFHAVKQKSFYQEFILSAVFTRKSLASFGDHR